MNLQQFITQSIRSRRIGQDETKEHSHYILSGLLCALYCVIPVFFNNAFGQTSIRQDISLNNNWRTIATDSDRILYESFFKENIIDKDWKQVNIPHNWDGYEGYRRLLHGNRHGDAWYRKTFSIRQDKREKRFFLFFEGVGSYATVFVNGTKVGEHAGGRTSFTINITGQVKTDGSNNLLAVYVSHPSGITDLPWVCGGCSDERGFSEGSQPMGIFRPVHLIITGETRIEPFGIHAWSNIENGKTILSIENTVKNYSASARNIVIVNQLIDDKGMVVAELSSSPQNLKPGDSITIRQNDLGINDPVLWEPAHPYLYTIVTMVRENDKLLDQAAISYGFRTVNWKTQTHQLFINGKPVFINGIAEYEHLLGQSHAFTHEQVRARMNWVKAAGFNAFRDAHQPHNLLYGHLCDILGILWWTQFSAHIWFDSMAFKNNFKELLKEWIIERRNDPSVILWGLQNESKLPEAFAKECTDIIRQLDPTASSQRLVTTCNGGSGTDWDVPQNWTGTYGGDPNTYAADLKRQVLVGEYGAWRTIDLHTEGAFVQDAAVSEDRMTLLMEQKIRLAESVKDSSAGHFFWLLSSHDNPGRVQGGEGLRELDRIGPVNYKGLLTAWEEPTDAFYMFRANYASKETEPMVYIVSHTWPGRWMTPGKKSGIIVYSNCDEVELFNDIGHLSLGKRRRNGIGTHFQWDDVMISYNLLYAVGYINGEIAARDTIVLHYLPQAPHFSELFTNTKSITAPRSGYHYIYRINCGGPDYTDENGNKWFADRAISGEKPGVPAYFSSSWTNSFSGTPSFFASQRRSFDAVKGTNDWTLFRNFRYGKDKLQFEFPLPDGEYLVELYFMEPWLGIGGGMNATGMRLFDVAINNKTVLAGLDIWKEAGTNTALKKMVKATVTGGKMIISFPQSNAGEALVSAIAIASVKNGIKPAPSPSLITKLSGHNTKASTWLDIGNRQYSDTTISFHDLPPALYAADWIQLNSRKANDPVSFTVTGNTDVFVAIDKTDHSVPAWLKDYEDTQTAMETDESGGKKYKIYWKRFSKNARVQINPGNDGRPGAIILTPVTSMQPAYDLKPVKTYPTDAAVLSEGIEKETVAGRESVVVKSDEKIQLEWLLQFGVADIYSFTVKYYYAGETKLSGAIQLIGSGSTMMLNEPVTFTFTRPGKWNTITFHTRGMINAGNYTLKIETAKAKGLIIPGIDVQ